MPSQECWYCGRPEAENLYLHVVNLERERMFTVVVYTRWTKESGSIAIPRCRACQDRMDALFKSWQWRESTWIFVTASFALVVGVLLAFAITVLPLIVRLVTVGVLGLVWVVAYRLKRGVGKQRKELRGALRSTFDYPPLKAAMRRRWFPKGRDYF
jgi:hypothetical protein